MVPVLRIIGPPGSGKTLLIVSLTEALRSRGHRVASIAPRRNGATVLVLSNAGRVTLEQPLPLTRLQTVAPSLDPSVQIILAEGYAAPEDTAFPSITLGEATDASAIAHVTTEEIEALFARLGPGETNGLVDLVETRVLGLPPREVVASGWRGLLRRWRRRS